jgi:hypothetical protein
MARWFSFLIAIFIGLGIGLGYGWFINPVHSEGQSPDTLRIDYKADYVLMVAEAFLNEQDIEQAARRLAVLGDSPPAEQIQQAYQFAQKAGYNETDLERMQSLYRAMQAALSGKETAIP